jgi:hypothetical protein
MKLLRIWVPDPSSPEFAKETERQAKLLRGHPSEKEALDFIEAAFEGGAIGGLAMTAYRTAR